jgi:hypothetical protein
LTSQINQTLNTERGISGTEPLNVRKGGGYECSVINPREKIREGDGRVVSSCRTRPAMARENCPDESGKGTVTLSKASLIGGERSRAFEPTMVGGSGLFSRV